MKMRNYLKKKEERVELESFTSEDVTLVKQKSFKKSFLMMVLGLLILVPVLFLFFTHNELKNVSLGEESDVQFSIVPVAAVTEKKGIISIPSGTVKANPFLPYRDIGAIQSTNDVPSATLVEPPQVSDVSMDAIRVMDTIVSGILFDKYSPSAILNIEGNDYLVKKGDVVNNYEVMNILPDSVTVKLGANVYKAGIGEILTEGSLNYNDVSNLNKKFGGVQ